MGRPSTLPTVTAARPDLIVDWHPENDKTPDQVSIGSKYKARWKCRNIITFRGRQRACGYEWNTPVQNRARTGLGCPACSGYRATDWNNLAELHAHHVDEWDPENDLAAHEVTPGSGYKAKWICRDCGHKWSTTPDKRTGRGSGCPECASNGPATPANNLAMTADPILIRDWHPTENIKPMDQYRPHSNELVWWQCGNTVTYHDADQLCGHEWSNTPNVRSRGVGCPACAGFVAMPWNNIPYTNPELVLDWHEDNPMSPEETTKGQHDVVKWRCHNVVDKFGTQEPCGYVWNTQIYNRSQGKGCPACCGHVVTEWNSLGACHPYLLPTWDPENIKTAFEVTPGGMYHASWICDNTITLGGAQVTCGHKWKTRAVNRVLGTGCPECMLWTTSKDEIHLAHELALFYTVDNTGRRIQGADQKWKIDIVLPDLNIIVEYDGSYWHRDKTERDLRKSTDLTAAGWTVIRAREHPLDALTPNDVLCRTGDYKNTSNAVLSQIAAITGTPVNGLAEYLTKPTIQNGEAALQQATELRAKVFLNRAKRQAARSA